MSFGESYLPVSAMQHCLCVEDVVIGGWGSREACRCVVAPMSGGIYQEGIVYKAVSG